MFHRFLIMVNCVVPFSMCLHFIYYFSISRNDNVLFHLLAGFCMSCYFEDPFNKFYLELTTSTKVEYTYTWQFMLVENCTYVSRFSTKNYVPVDLDLTLLDRNPEPEEGGNIKRRDWKDVVWRVKRKYRMFGRTGEFYLEFSSHLTINCQARLKYHPFSKTLPSDMFHPDHKEWMVKHGKIGSKL